MSDGGGASWELSVRLHGEALGRTNDAERLLIDWDRRVAALRSRLGDNAPDTAVSVVLVGRDGILMAGADSFPGRVLSDVGLGRPPSQDGVRESETVAPDQIPALDGRVILLSVAPGAEERLAELERDPALEAPARGPLRRGRARRRGHLVVRRRHPRRARRTRGSRPHPRGQLTQVY